MPSVLQNLNVARNLTPIRAATPSPNIASPPPNTGTSQYSNAYGSRQSRQDIRALRRGGDMGFLAYPLPVLWGIDPLLLLEEDMLAGTALAEDAALAELWS